MPKKFGKRLEKICCEICSNDNKEILHLHHLVERTELNTNNHSTNICCLCPNCHTKIHKNKIKVVGLFNSTKQPYGRTVIYIDEQGVCSFPGMELEKSYYGLANESMKIPEESKNNE